MPLFRDFIVVVGKLFCFLSDLRFFQRFPTTPMSNFSFSNWLLASAASLTRVDATVHIGLLALKVNGFQPPASCLIHASAGSASPRGALKPSTRSDQSDALFFLACNSSLDERERIDVAVATGKRLLEMHAGKIKR